MPDIEPGSPWENPFVESFNGRVRDELLNLENFATLAEAQVIVEAWRVEYNTQRPHSALGGLTPDEYARRYGTPGHAAAACAARESRWRSPHGRRRDRAGWLITPVVGDREPKMSRLGAGPCGRSPRGARVRVTGWIAW